jgi:glutathione S-transferase
MTTTKPYCHYMTPTSPFARKVRMVVHECGLTDQVEDFNTRVRTPENEVLAVSPLGKVPTLTGPGGLVLVDSTIICEFLDRLSGAPRLHHEIGPARWVASRLWSLSESLLESLAWRARELRRPVNERSPRFLEYETDRQARIYDWLEASLPTQAPRDISAIGLVIAIDYADYRFPEDNWHTGRPNLQAWFEAEAARPAFQATLLPPKS